MKPKRYKEFKVELQFSSKKQFTIKHKWPTDRGHVSIHEHEAELLNSQVKQTHKWYELDESEIEQEIEQDNAKAERVELEAKAARHRAARHHSEPWKCRAR